MRRVNKGHKRPGKGNLRQSKRDYESIVRLNKTFGRVKRSESSNASIKRPLVSDRSLDFAGPMVGVLEGYRVNRQAYIIKKLGVSVVGNSTFRHISKFDGLGYRQILDGFQRSVEEYDDIKLVVLDRFKVNTVRTGLGNDSRYHYVVGIFDRISEGELRLETGAVLDGLGVAEDSYNIPQPHLTVAGCRDESMARDIVTELQSAVIGGDISRGLILGPAVLHFSEMRDATIYKER